MARRSLKASTAGIEIAKKAFRMKEWTQEYLATEVGLETRQPIWKFFTGKPIERQTFMEICFQLGLDWQEIADIPTQSLLTEKKLDWDYCRYIDSLVQMVRSRRSDKIQAQCATIRLLDIAQPTELEDIYVSVNVLNYITSQRWLDICDLQGLVEEERFGLNQCQEQIGAMQAVAIYPKLLVLGKPGSGKTTFLQYLAMQCDRGKFLADQIPIFIRLKNFAEDARETGNFSLLNYITQELAHLGISDQQIQILLTHGRFLFLLDGLDEISEDDSAEIVKKICKLSEEYYKNQLIITCRVATRQYHFEGFTDIEIADFDSSQIQAFVQKWFVNVGRNSREQGKALATEFVQNLHKSENRQIRELAATPLLLNLVCGVFQARSDFPTRRAEVYQQALDVLLYRWDQVRRIKRHEDCNHLSFPHQLNLLSYIAAITFEQERYFFTQSSVQQYITDYLCNLSASKATLEVLQINSEAVLKSLEVRGILVERSRGIYSFSHLTFQEYLTARNIASSQPQKLAEKPLEAVSQLTEPRWRKVFLLTASMLADATDLLELMKQHIDALVNFDRQLQQFPIWLNQKSLSVEAPYKSAAIRAFYLRLTVFDDLTLPDESLCFAIDPQFNSNLAPDLALDRDLSRALYLSLDLPYNPVERILTLSATLPDDRTVGCNPELQRSLQQLKKRLPTPRDIEKLEKWWNTNRNQAWAEKLRAVMVQYRNIGDRWQLSEEHKQVLRQYYTANQLLVDCLKLCYEVTPTVREKILGTLLLPVATTSDSTSNDRELDGYIEYCA